MAQIRVKGPRACFTRPEMRSERVSYDVMTPSAARSVLEAIHWKPAIRWVVEEIRVLAPIRFETLRRNEVSAKGSIDTARSAAKKGSLAGVGIDNEATRTQRHSLILRDVDYVVRARFELTALAGPDDNERKHADIFSRRLAAGQCFRMPFLGCREFAAEVSEVGEMPAPDASLLGERDLGFMLWDRDYSGGANPVFFRAAMVNGVISVPQPGSEDLVR